jgi:PQQ-like domain
MIYPITNCFLITFVKRLFMSIVKFLSYCSILFIVSCNKQKDLADTPTTIIIDTIAVPPSGPILTNETTTEILFTYRETDALGNYFTTLTCLNPDLSLRWRKNNYGNIGTPSCFAENGKVFLSFSTNLQCYNITTGALLWSKSLVSESIDIVSIRNDTIYTTRSLNGVNGLAAYNCNNGSLYWYSPNTDQFAPYAVNLDANFLYYISSPNLTAQPRYVSFNTTSRTTQWLTSQTTLYISNISTPSFTNDKVGFTIGSALGGSTLVAISKSDGSISWTKTSNLGVPTCTADRFFVVDDYQGLYALNAQSGATLWQISLGGQIFVLGQPFISGQNLYLIAQSFSDVNNYLYSFNANTGLLNYKKKIIKSSGFLQYNIVIGKNLYCLSNNGYINNTTPGISKLYVFEAGTGVLKDSTSIVAMDIGHIGIKGSSGKLVFSH